MAVNPQDIVGWLDLLDVALQYAQEIKQNMVDGVPATKEQFATLRAEFQAEHDRVEAQLTAPDGTEPAPPGTQLLG